MVGVLWRCRLEGGGPRPRKLFLEEIMAKRDQAFFDKLVKHFSPPYWYSKAPTSQRVVPSWLPSTGRC